ncbi:MAG: allantoate amidohydrolase [Beijerinckiaceae bacterium]
MSVARLTGHADDGAIIMARADALAQFSSDGPSQLTRLYLTPEHRQAADQVAHWMREAGMHVHEDAVGTVVGRLGSAQQDAKTVLIGSHIDTVRNAGKYDGNLGVLLAIQAVQRITRAGHRLPFAIEVLAFGDEEGVRFPVTLTSSRAVAGIFDPATLAVMDADGISLGDALAAFGCDTVGIPAIARRPADILAYVEAHIEQGPVLENQDLPVGIVTAISGATRLKVTVSGVAGHAGTVPMELRRDASTAAAEMALAVERIARERADIVGTVGRFVVTPGAVNVIPSGVEFTVDVRSPDDGSRHAALAAMRDEFSAIAQRRGIGLKAESFYDEAAATCSAPVIAALEKAVAAQGLSPLCLPSGAGHDGLAMAALCPIGMLFVRCKGGISHNPAEAITAADAQTACDVLVDFLLTLDPAQFSAA